MKKKEVKHQGWVGEIEKECRRDFSKSQKRLIAFIKKHVEPDRQQELIALIVASANTWLALHNIVNAREHHKRERQTWGD